jgi:hypothetical protein
MATWRSILGSPESPDIACANATAHAQGELGYVVCEERLGDTMLIATNVFVRERGAWKLAHHQAGHVAAQVPEEPPFPPVAGGDHTVN